ncbi:DNA-directed RNA polymerase II subunit RPB11-a [Gurleya vavrai]
MSYSFLTITKDKQTPNTVEICINGETHTLGNLVSEKLLQDPRCTFSAYKVEHPLEDKFYLKVSATDEIDVLLLINQTLSKLSEEIYECKSQFMNIRHEIN